jgi:hypothetical protein
MVASPADTPVTKPPDVIVAKDGLALLHTPPLVLLARVVLPAIHMFLTPPPIGAGAGFTVTIALLLQVVGKV